MKNQVNIQISCKNLGTNSVCALPTSFCFGMRSTEMVFLDRVDEPKSNDNNFHFLNQIPRGHLPLHRDFGY